MPHTTGRSNRASGGRRLKQDAGTRTFNRNTTALKRDLKTGRFIGRPVSKMMVEERHRIQRR